MGKSGCIGEWWDGAGGAVQFWATHDNTKLGGVGDNGRGLERGGIVCPVVGATKSRACRRCSLMRPWRMCLGRTVCNGSGQNPASEEKLDDGGNKLAESAEDAGVQGGDPSYPTVRACFLADTLGGWLQSCPPNPLSTCLPVQSKTRSYANYSSAWRMIPTTP